MLNTIMMASSIFAICLLKEHTVSDCGAAIRRFNDKNRESGTLITSLQLRAFGTNFHGVCSTTIIEQPPSMSTLQQVISRLWSVGGGNVHGTHEASRGGFLLDCYKGGEIQRHYGLGDRIQDWILCILSPFDRTVLVL